MGDLLPFFLFQSSFRCRDGFSLTVFVFPTEFRVETRLLSYRFRFSNRVSGGESASLIPFSIFYRVFGRRDLLSLTFFAFSTVFRAERPPFSYRLIYSKISGPEIHKKAVQVSSPLHCSLSYQVKSIIIPAKQNFFWYLRSARPTEILFFLAWIEDDKAFGINFCKFSWDFLKLRVPTCRSSSGTNHHY